MTVLPNLRIVLGALTVAVGGVATVACGDRPQPPIEAPVVRARNGVAPGDTIEIHYVNAVPVPSAMAAASSSAGES